MKKLLYFCLLFVWMIPSIVFSKDLELSSKEYLLYDLDKNMVLYEKDSDKIVSIASLTKIMTTIVAIENIDDFNETVYITYDMLKDVPWDSSVAGLSIGDEVTYLDLLYASILPSGADATNSLAISLTGSIDNFVDMMNDKAQELNLFDTHFSNTTGYDIDNHYSTANDILKLLVYSLSNQTFKKIYTTNKYTLSNGLEIESTLSKYNNKINFNTKNIVGSKTGFTENAGLCMTSLINIENNNFIFISLDAEYEDGIAHNLIDTINVISYVSKIYEEKNILFSIPIKYSILDYYDIYIDDSLFISKYNKSDISYEYYGLVNLNYKNKKNDKIGHIKYYYKDKLLYEEDLYLNKDIKFSLSQYMNSNGHNLIVCILLLIFSILFLIKILKVNT